MDWLSRSLERVREKRPLIHNITNFVVMNTTANALLALGASPIMAHSPEEVEELVASADAVVVNIGTLDHLFTYSMIKAVAKARELGKPVVLDPVGAGATTLRTRVATYILSLGGVSTVRGNFGEISALSGELGKTRGVDTAVYDESVAREIVKSVAKKYSTVAAVTGSVDYVSNGERVYAIKPGAPSTEELVQRVIRRVTGLGCIVTALIGAYLAVEDPLKATIAGIVTFKVAAEEAVKEAPYPGSFHVKLYDWLYRLSGDTLSKLAEGRIIEA
jgi:hydroxyethylthiazole kinase